MVFEIVLYRGRTHTERFTFKDSNGDAITIASTDEPRFKVFQGNNTTPELDLYGGALANSSVITTLTQSGATLGKVDVQFAQDDTSGLSLGVHDAEISLVDDSGTNPTDPIITAEIGIVHVIGTGGGDVGTA